MLLAVLGACALSLRAEPMPQPPPAPAPAPPPAAVRPLSVLEDFAGPATPDDLEVMTFNLRYGSTATPNSWADRRPVMRALLAAERPHLIGTQEGLPTQLRDLDHDLGAGYGRVGLGREGGDRGEHMAIFFDRARLLRQRSGDFWLSQTPEIPGSTSWGSAHVRMVTWALFTDRVTGRRFYAVNTHLDNRSENARRWAAELIVKRLAAFAPLPVVLTGDFNSPGEPGNRVHQILTGKAGLSDTWTSAPRHGPEYATIHNYEPLVPGGKRVDWILTTPGITAVAALMNTYRQQAQYPSDHLPVQARLRLP
jgi:endonuclease/exonuclease/phosphatase family metal-dependent hydrolase